MNEQQTLRKDDPAPVAFVLIAIGLALFADQFLDFADFAVLGSISVVFVVALVATRAYGFLIPAMIFAGLSAGTYAVSLGEDSGGAVVLGLGGGFIAIYALSSLFFARSHWWPLIPGTILTLVGGSLVFGGAAGAELAGRVWPLVLVGIGLLMLLGAGNARRPQAPPR